MLLTQQDVADELQVCLKTVKRLRQSGRLRFIQLGPHTIRIRLEELEKFKQLHTASLPAGFSSRNNPVGEGAEATAPQSGQIADAVSAPADQEVQ